MPTTHGSALWQGGIKDGKGAISTKSGALKEYPYGFASRFEGKPGTNPEELIGAAHAGCFSMALSGILAGDGNPPDSISTDAKVSFEQQGEGWAITGIELTTRGSVPGMDEDAFRAAAETAKEACPVSVALSVPITLNASLA